MPKSEIATARRYRTTPYDRPSRRIHNAPLDLSGHFNHANHTLEQEMSQSILSRISNKLFSFWRTESISNNSVNPHKAATRSKSQKPIESRNENVRNDSERTGQVLNYRVPHYLGQTPRSFRNFHLEPESPDNASFFIERLKASENKKTEATDGLPSQKQSLQYCSPLQGSNFLAHHEAQSINPKGVTLSSPNYGGQVTDGLKGAISRAYEKKSPTSLNHKSLNDRRRQISSAAVISAWRERQRQLVRQPVASQSVSFNKNEDDFINGNQPGSAHRSHIQYMDKLQRSKHEKDLSFMESILRSSSKESTTKESFDAENTNLDSNFEQESSRFEHAKEFSSAEIVQGSTNLDNDQIKDSSENSAESMFLEEPVEIHYSINTTSENETLDDTEAKSVSTLQNDHSNDSNNSTKSLNRKINNASRLKRNFQYDDDTEIIESHQNLNSFVFRNHDISDNSPFRKRVRRNHTNSSGFFSAWDEDLESFNSETKNTEAPYRVIKSSTSSTLLTPFKPRFPLLDEKVEILKRQAEKLGQKVPLKETSTNKLESKQPLDEASGNKFPLKKPDIIKNQSLRLETSNELSEGSDILNTDQVKNTTGDIFRKPSDSLSKKSDPSLLMKYGEKWTEQQTQKPFFTNFEPKREAPQQLLDANREDYSKKFEMKDNVSENQSYELTPKTQFSSTQKTVDESNNLTDKFQIPISTTENQEQNSPSPQAFTFQAKTVDQKPNTEISEIKVTDTKKDSTFPFQFGSNNNAIPAPESFDNGQTNRESKESNESTLKTSPPAPQFSFKFGSTREKDTENLFSNAVSEVKSSDENRKWKDEQSSNTPSEIRQGNGSDEKQYDVSKTSEASRNDSVNIKPSPSFAFSFNQTGRINSTSHAEKPAIADFHSKKTASETIPSASTDKSPAAKFTFASQASGPSKTGNKSSTSATTLENGWIEKNEIGSKATELSTAKGMFQFGTATSTEQNPPAFKFNFQPTVSSSSKEGSAAPTFVFGSNSPSFSQQKNDKPASFTFGSTGNSNNSHTFGATSNQSQNSASIASFQPTQDTIQSTESTLNPFAAPFSFQPTQQGEAGGSSQPFSFSTQHAQSNSRGFSFNAPQTAAANPFQSANNSLHFNPGSFQQSNFSPSTSSIAGRKIAPLRRRRGFGR